MDIFDRNVIGSYPRPDFRRPNWQDLTGEWDFDFDDNNVGIKNKWYSVHRYSKKICVPFCYQSKQSGIQDISYHPVIWYSRSFNAVVNDRRSILLHFGAVDYFSTIWINQSFVGTHCGGHSSFVLDITDVVSAGINNITIRVEDTNSCEQPRGKQIWKSSPERCWYTATSGIWQEVWLEFTGKTYFENVHFIPNYDMKSVIVSTRWRGIHSDHLKCSIWLSDILVSQQTIKCVDKNSLEFIITLNHIDPVEDHISWSPDHPVLFNVELVLFADGNQEDLMYSYFGFRKIATRDGLFLLNDTPLYQKLVLNQGYWIDGLMTPPSPRCFYNDILTIKKMGFNGTRMHQKIENPKFLYWADVLGLIVWEEMPSNYDFTYNSIDKTIHEWEEIIQRDINHPSIFVWVPFNESWGIRDIYDSIQQQNYAISVYYLTKALDPTRLVSINDGWEQLEQSDICSIHDYMVTGETFEEKYHNLISLLKTDAQGKMLYANGHKWKGQPIIISEFGGKSIGKDTEGWGYYENVLNSEDYVSYLSSLILSVKSIHEIKGYCYTQFTDVMQEKNGLLDEQRVPKIPIEKMSKINNSFN